MRKIRSCVNVDFFVLLSIARLAQDFLSLDLSSMHNLNKILMSNYPFISILDYGTHPKTPIGKDLVIQMI